MGSRSAAMGAALLLPPLDRAFPPGTLSQVQHKALGSFCWEQISHPQRKQAGKKLRSQVNMAYWDAGICCAPVTGGSWGPSLCLLASAALTVDGICMQKYPKQPTSCCVYLAVSTYGKINLPYALCLMVSLKTIHLMPNAFCLSLRPVNTGNVSRWSGINKINSLLLKYSERG